MKRLLALGVATMLLSLGASAQKFDNRNDKIRQERRETAGKSDKAGKAFNYRDVHTHSMMDGGFRGGPDKFRDGGRMKSNAARDLRSRGKMSHHQKNWKKQHGRKKYHGGKRHEGKHYGGKHQGGKHHRYHRS